MPRLSIWFIRTALVYFAVGITLGGLLLFSKGTQQLPSLWLLLPTHIELMLIGWTVQLVLGVAFWMFPRHTYVPKRGNETLIWLSYGLLNGGLLLHLFVPGNTSLALAGQVGIALSIVLFTGSIFRRTRGWGG